MYYFISGSSSWVPKSGTHPTKASRFCELKLKEAQKMRRSVGGQLELKPCPPPQFHKLPKWVLLPRALLRVSLTNVLLRRLETPYRPRSDCRKCPGPLSWLADGRQGEHASVVSLTESHWFAKLHAWDPLRVPLWAP